MTGSRLTKQTGKLRNGACFAAPRAALRLPEAPRAGCAEGPNSCRDHAALLASGRRHRRCSGRRARCPRDHSNLVWKVFDVRNAPLFPNPFTSGQNVRRIQPRDGVSFHTTPQVHDSNCGGVSQMAIAGGRDRNLRDPRAGAASATHLPDQGVRRKEKRVPSLS